MIAWRLIAPIVSLAMLANCQEVGSGQRVAVGPEATSTGPEAASTGAAMTPADAGAATTPADAGAATTPADAGAATTFRPCGESARPGAALEKAAADAKAYVDGCHPVIRAVRCAHKITPLCAYGRCALKVPPGE